MNHARRFLDETAEIASLIDAAQVEVMAQELVVLRQRKGRLFMIGLGGSAANASHAVNDFRKLCGIDAYAPTDNIAELTARANDEGWITIFDSSFWKTNDVLFVLSVGGGQGTVSIPISLAVNRAKQLHMKVLGIVGRDGGNTAKRGDCVIIIPPIVADRVTPHTEAFQSVILHCLVSHPELQVNKTKW